MANQPTPGSRNTSRWTRWGLRTFLATASAVTLALSTALTATAAPTPPAPPGPAPSVSAALAAGLAGPAQPITDVRAQRVAPPDRGAPVIRRVHDSTWGDSRADLAAKSRLGRNTAVADPGSLYTISQAIGARKVWNQKDDANRQITGQGVAVALLDSGVVPVPGLDGADKVVLGPDLTADGDSDVSGLDTFGHGTHMAGIIAANDGVDLRASEINRISPDTQLGVAPDATIESLKLANADGSTDVSQVIAALDWITQHQVLPDGTRVRVVNLSFGTDSEQAYQSDPLAAAAENAWRHGLVVVVSGGNEGNDAGRLTNPAIDPYVISVGASDGGGTAAGWWNPGVASFSSGGTAERHVDVLAPGRSIVSLRDPGSFLDVNHPEGRVDGDASGRLFRGSGTSQAAAVVSGAVALLLQAYPNLTPDQVKDALMSTATPVAASPILAGSGQIDVFAALRAAKKLNRSNPLDVAQTWPAADGQGTIEGARGSDHLVDADGVELTGEFDIQGQPWVPATWWAATTSLTAWQDGSWNGAQWTGGDWELDGADGLTSARWSSARWSSARWSSARWSSARWSSARWSGDQWSSARWSSARWSSARWSGSDWS